MPTLGVMAVSERATAKDVRGVIAASRTFPTPDVIQHALVALVPLLAADATGALTGDLAADRELRSLLLKVLADRIGDVERAPLTSPTTTGMVQALGQLLLVVAGHSSQTW